jgi:hypothetical protein
MASFEALLIEALLIETNESAIPVEIDERNQLAIPLANTTEPSVEDVHTFNTLVSPPLPLCSIPSTGFGQFHAL